VKKGCEFNQKRCELKNFLYFLFFAFRHLNIAFLRVSTFDIERKITSLGNAYSKPPITIESHDLRTCDITEVVSEIASYHKKGLTLAFLWFL
jgi:hypothetical protein